MHHPADMTPQQRVDEIASILSIAIIRTRLKKTEEKQGQYTGLFAAEERLCRKRGGEKT